METLVRAEVREVGTSKLWGTREGSEVHYHELWGLFLFWWEEQDGLVGGGGVNHGEFKQWNDKVRLSF